MSSSANSPEPSEQSTGFNPVTLSYVSRSIAIYQISDPELDRIAGSGASLELTLFGICAGALITLVITLTTVSIPNPRSFAAFVSTTAISFLASIFFGWRGIGKFLDSKKELKDLRRGGSAMQGIAAAGPQRP